MPCGPCGQAFGSQGSGSRTYQPPSTKLPAAHWIAPQARQKERQTPGARAAILAYSWHLWLIRTCGESII